MKVNQAYEPPTFFGVAYANRLFAEVGGDAYQLFCDQIGSRLHLEGSDVNCHADFLLRWLNKWGCRIDSNRFHVIKPKLAEWFQNQDPLLRHLDLTELTEQHLNLLERSFLDIRQITGLGPTAAAKVLFAAYPGAAIAWDAPIREVFELDASSKSYRKMLSRSQEEARPLAEQIARFGVGEMDWGKGHCLTWPLLLDNYHWVTTTRGHQIPTIEDLKQWANWAGKVD